MATSSFAAADSLRLFEDYAAALPRYRRLGDSLAAAMDTAGWWKAELWWGYSQMRLGYLDSAEMAIQLARDLAGTRPERRAWTRVVTSNLLSLKGAFDSATVEAETARQLAEGVGDDQLQHAISYALGWVYSSTGRSAEAFAVDSQALQRRRALGGMPRTALAAELNAIGIDYYWMGRYSDAAVALEEALAVYRQLGQLRGATRVIVTLAEVYQRTGDPERAVDLYAEALRYSDAAGERSNEVAVLHNNLAILYQDRNPAAARLHYDRALSIARVSRQPYAQVLSLFGLGKTELAAGNLAQARKAFHAALRLADSLGFAFQRVGLLTELALLSASEGDIRAASRWSAAATLLADSIGNPNEQLNAMVAQGAVLEARGQLAAAAAANLKALDVLESWRGRESMNDMRLVFGHAYLVTYENAIRLLFQANRVAEAFEVAERAHARLLLDLLAERSAADAQSYRHGALRQELRDQLAKLEAATPEQRREVDREIRSLGVALDRLEAEVRRSDPAGAARYPAPASLAEIRASLVHTGRSLLAFFWGQDEVYGWWITADSVRGRRLGSADSLEALVDFLRSSIESHQPGLDWRAPARRAYQTFVAPLAPTPEPETLVIPDGPLAHLPAEVFVPTGDTLPWGAHRRLAYGPSASVLLALSRRARTESWKHTVLAVGNPAVGAGRVADSLRAANESDPGPLPHAAREARAIYQLFRPQGADLLIGGQATVERWQRLDPARYRYLHFAAHARVNDRRPERTHLVLSQGVLALPDIRKLRLHADLVTLSACETGLGRRVRGEGIIGLPHAFFAAGARGVLVSLWRIADPSAADFMRDFYQELHAGRSPADALLAVRQRWIGAGGAQSHPSRWGPFILVGGIQQ